MTTPTTDLPALLGRAGFRPRAGAASAAVARVEAAFGVRLPDELAALWAYTDGAAGDGIELLSPAAAEEYAGVFAGGLGTVPLTDCNDSNPYAVCCRGPLVGFVAHVFHDDEPALVCRGLGRFLELVAEAREGGAVARITSDLAFDRPDRTADDAARARVLVRAAGAMEPDDIWRGTVLRFAAQLMGAGQEDELAGVLALGDEYAREAVLERWAALGTPAAAERLRADAAAYRAFLTELRRAFVVAGVRTEGAGRDEYRLQPGNVGLNFVMLFAACRRPEAMDEWVQRFKIQLSVGRP
jgi:hypothetical protein